MLSPIALSGVRASSACSRAFRTSTSEKTELHPLSSISKLTRPPSPMNAGLPSNCSTSSKNNSGGFRNSNEARQGEAHDRDLQLQGMWRVEDLDDDAFMLFSDDQGEGDGLALVLLLLT
eukprot:scaffold8195_cov305-Pinguiococcus_pyrenoidosus.AAC.2